MGWCHFFTLLLGSLSGCASISQEECLLGDWYQIGLSDGQYGRSNRAADYSKDCSEYQVKMDLKSYNKGRSEGLKRIVLMIMVCRLANLIRDIVMFAQPISRVNFCQVIVPIKT